MAELHKLYIPKNFSKMTKISATVALLGLEMV